MDHLGNVPANTGRVDEMDLTLAPRIERGLFHLHRKRITLNNFLDFRPPAIKILDLQLNHEIALESFIMKILKEKFQFSDSKNAQSIVGVDLFKAKSLEKCLCQAIILAGWNERAKLGRSQKSHCHLIFSYINNLCILKHRKHFSSPD